MDAWQEIEELRQQLARLAMVGRVSDVNEAKRQVLVLVLYLPVFGGDGFVLGSVGGLG